MKLDAEKERLLRELRKQMDKARDEWRDAPKVTEGYRLKRYEEARERVRLAEKELRAGTPPARKAEGPRCWCGAGLIVTSHGASCADGSHDG